MKMTKRERVLAALQGLSCDGIPCCFTKHFPLDERFGEAGVKAHLRFFSETDTDIQKIMNEHLIPAAEGLHFARDWREVPSYGPKEEFIERQIDFVKRIMENCKDNGFRVGTLHGACASSIHLLEPRYGYEISRQMLCAHFRENKAVVLDAFKRIAQAQCFLARRYMEETNLDGVYYAALGGETHFYTDEEFEVAVLEFDKMILDEIHRMGGTAIVHICKNQLNMQRYRDYRDWGDVFNWSVDDAPMTLTEGRALFGKTLLGGLSNKQGPLITGQFQALKTEIQTIIDKAGKTNFILGADCTLPMNINAMNIHAACEIAHAWQ